MKVIDKIITILSYAAGMTILILLFIGPFMQGIPYYITLSVCAAVIIVKLYFEIEVKAYGND